MRKSAKVFIPSTAFKYTLPPRPPSPPSGPPKGTKFSRRKLTQPRPPLPACTLSLASSTDFIDFHPTALTACETKKGQVALPLHGFIRRALSIAELGSPASLLGNDVDVGVLLGTL